MIIGSSCRLPLGECDCPGKGRLIVRGKGYKQKFYVLREATKAEYLADNPRHRGDHPRVFFYYEISVD